MAENIDPVKYAENIMEAWSNDDELAVKKIEETYGDQEVTLKDLESLFAYTLSTLSTAYVGLDQIYQKRYDEVMITLEEKNVITEEEYHKKIEEDKRFSQAIEGTNTEGDEE